MRSSLLILGASVRAAAQSARRAEWQPIGGDLFGDADLTAICPTYVARRYPADLASIGSAAPPGPWLYTGGLENHPALVARISRTRTLLGNPPEVLRRLRDPFQLAQVFERHGIDWPECRPVGDPPARDGSWLIKHRRSSGGLRVAVWDDRSARSSEARRANASARSGWYFQRRLSGLPCSAVFLACGGAASLLGVSEQLLLGGHGAPFQYAGSLGPLRVSAALWAVVARMGDVIAGEFAPRGLFGVDFLLRGDLPDDSDSIGGDSLDGADIVPVEVNPRYTASVEVLERALGESAIGLHVSACLGAARVDLPAPNVGLPPAPRWYGKQIVYAGSKCVISERATADMLELNRGRDWPLIADIPSPGTRLVVGQPAATVLGEATSRAALVEQLSARQIEARRLLGER